MPVAIHRPSYITHYRPSSQLTVRHRAPSFHSFVIPLPPPIIRHPPPLIRQLSSTIRRPLPSVSPPLPQSVVVVVGLVDSRRHRRVPFSAVLSRSGGAPGRQIHTKRRQFIDTVGCKRVCRKMPHRLFFCLPGGGFLTTLTANPTLPSNRYTG